MIRTTKATVGAAIASFAIAASAVVAPGLVTSGVAGAATPLAGCTGTSGVTVIVDFTHFGGKIERGCAPGAPANGLVALHAAGFTSAGTTQYGDAFVCRIDGLPAPKQETCAVTPSASASWSYWNARPSDAKWTYSNLGVLDYQPEPGTIEAFAFGSRAQPGVTPSGAIRNPTTTTTVVAPPPPPPPSTDTQPAPVAAATAPPPTPTTDVPVAALGPTGTTTAPAKKRPAAPSTTTERAASTTATTVEIVERSASAKAAATSDASSSPLAAVLTVAIVGGLAIGAFAFTRARRNRPA